MNSTDLRIECLRLAAQANQQHEIVVVAAQAYLAFVTEKAGIDPAASETTATEDR